MRTGMLLSEYVDEASPGRRWCPVSQSPADGPGPASPWDAFSGQTPPPPGPGQAALLGEAVGALDELDERQALGVSSAARRMRAHADYAEIMAVARFGRVRAAQLEASKARGDRVRSRDGEYPAEELGFEMTASAYSAGLLLDMAANIVTRPPTPWPGWPQASSTGTGRGRSATRPCTCPTTSPP